MTFADWIGFAARVIEAAGVLTIVAGGLIAVVLASWEVARRHSGAEVYKRLRQRIGRAILLGLELLVGADIIRTVAESPTLRDVVVLAIIVLVRTFLSVALEVELEGRWPWHARALES